MNSILILIVAGFIIGTSGTLIGAGGGFILVPLLLLTHPNMPPGIVTAISIAIVAINAISGSIAYAKSKRIDYKTGIVFALFTIPGSVAGVFVTKYIPVHLFNIIFGLLLIILAIYLFIKNSKPVVTIEPFDTNKSLSGNIKLRHIIDSEGQSFYYSFNQTYGIIISIVVGFLSPILGIGGGIIHVPAMVQWLQFPVYIATATSHFILAIMATVSVGVHIYQGDYNDPYIQKMVLGLGIGVIPGALLGAFLSHKIKTHIIIRVLAICLALVGLRILL